ncbi:MAG: DUF4911 domain-containing protein [Candidatus Sumerlaeia bacterium]|nr:DUF4911 domain-containing protein [Candidatus Sumerlaeia bacterium]
MRGRFTYKKYAGGDNIILRLRLPAEQIGYLSGTIEAYDGIGLVRTIDEQRGVVEVWIPREQLDTFEEVLEGLQREIKLERLV